MPRPEPFTPGFSRPQQTSSEERTGMALTPPRVHAFETDRLFELRVVVVHGHLDGERATDLCSKLMTLDAIGHGPIKLHLRTENADLPSAFAVFDTIDVLTCPVHVLLTGEVGGAALAVLAAAQRREMTRHAVLRLTEPRRQFDGTAGELLAQEAEHRRLVDALYIQLAGITGREVEEIRDDAERGRTFTATQALAYGLVQDFGGTAPPGLA